MEVIRRHSVEEEVVEQTKTRRSDFTATTADVTRTSSSSTSHSNTSGIEDSNNSEVSWSNSEISRKFTYPENTVDSALQWSRSEKNFNEEALVIPQIVNDVVNENGGKFKDSVVGAPILGQTSRNGDEIGTGDGVIENERSDLELGESDEEVIELEFERAFEKAHTHTPYCPNCNSQITRVVLRRKRRAEDRVKSAADNQPPPRELFGCLSCFSVFIPSGNRLNPFSIFGNKEKHKSSQAVQEKDTSSADVPASSGSTKENKKTVKPGSVFDLFGIFGMSRGETNSQHPEGNVGENNKSENSNHTPTVTHSGTNARVPPKRGRGDMVEESKKPEQDEETSPPLSVGSVIIDIKDGIDSFNKMPAPSSKLDHEIKEDSAKSNTRPDIVVRVIIPGARYQDPSEESSGRTGIQQQTRSDVYSGRQEIATRGFESVEILRCIVYGGLVESITSLGLVSSAASSGATKLNIVSLGLANVIGGLFVIGHNLMDMKTDSEHHGRRYTELLGNREHFLLHATFAMLSFLVFRLLPPVMYGFTEIWAVGAASFACIVILAIAKAYIKGAGKFSAYIKAILYYVTMAIAVSGVAFVAGVQINRLLEKLGWFEPNQASPSFAPNMDFGTQAWSSY